MALSAVARAFKAAGTRLVLGSAGCVGKVASWVKTASGTVEEHNLHLCKLRDIGIGIAEKEHAGFADVFWPRLYWFTNLLWWSLVQRWRKQGREAAALEEFAAAPAASKTSRASRNPLTASSSRAVPLSRSPRV